VPKPIKEGIAKAEAETIKKKFEDVGARPRSSSCRASGGARTPAGVRAS